MLCLSGFELYSRWVPLDVWLTFPMLHRVEITFLFICFELFRLQRNQDWTWTCHKLRSRVSQQKSCFKSERNEIFGSRGGRASDKIAMSLRAAGQIFNKEKDFLESLKYYLKMQTTNKPPSAESCHVNMAVLLSFYEKNRWRLGVRIIGTLTL